MINQYSNYFNAYIFYLAFSISFNFHLYLNFPSIFQIQFKLCLHHLLKQKYFSNRDLKLQRKLCLPCRYIGQECRLFFHSGYVKTSSKF